MKIKVSPAQSIGSFLRRHRLVKEGRADLHNLDISRVKWVRQQLRTVMIWVLSSVFIIGQSDTTI